MRFGGIKFFTVFIFILGMATLCQPSLTWAKSSSLPPKARPALYEFGAGFCHSCKVMEKVMAELQKTHGDLVEFRMVYADKEKDLFKQYKIMLIPTQVFLNAAGQELDRHSGPLTKAEVLKKLQELQLIK